MNMRRVAFDENKLAAGRRSVEVGDGDVHVDVEVHSGVGDGRAGMSESLRVSRAGRVKFCHGSSAERAL